MIKKCFILWTIIVLIIGFAFGSGISQYIKCRDIMWVSAKTAGRQMCEIAGYTSWGSVGVTDNVIDNLYCYIDYIENGTFINHTGKTIIDSGEITTLR